MLPIGYNFWSEWELREKVDFDGLNRLIIVYPHVTSLDIREDIWSAWVRWNDMEARGYDRWVLAMERTGLDSIPGGQTGDSYFLRNEWKLVVDLSKVAVTGILFSRDFGSAYYTPDLAIQFPAQVSAIVNTVNLPADSVLTAEQSLQLEQIHGQVERTLWYGSDAVINGNGYQQTPFNIVNDLIDEVEALGINKIKTFTDILLSRSLRNVRLEGAGIGSKFETDNPQNFRNTKIVNMQYKAESDGTDRFILEKCELLSGAGVHGYTDQCSLSGDITLTGSTHFWKCGSNAPGAGYFSIDTNGFTMQTTDWRRSLGIMNMVSGTHTIEIYGGQLHVPASNIGGLIYLRGNYSKPPNIDPASGTVVIDQTEKAQLLGTESFPHV